MKTKGKNKKKKTIVLAQLMHSSDLGEIVAGTWRLDQESGYSVDMEMDDIIHEEFQ